MMHIPCPSKDSAYPSERECDIYEWKRTEEEDRAGRPLQVRRCGCSGSERDRKRRKGGGQSR